MMGDTSLTIPLVFLVTEAKRLSFNASVHRKIGVLVSNRTTLPLSEITRIIFNTSPFDRYKQFFYFRIEDEFREDMANK